MQVPSADDFYAFRLLKSFRPTVIDFFGVGEMNRLSLFSSSGFDGLRNIVMSLDHGIVAQDFEIALDFRRTSWSNFGKTVKPFPQSITWQGGFHCITFVDQERYVRASTFHVFLLCSYTCNLQVGLQTSWMKQRLG